MKKPTIRVICLLAACLFAAGCGRAPADDAAPTAAPSEAAEVMESAAPEQTDAVQTPEPHEEGRFYTFDFDAKNTVMLSSVMAETDDSFYYLTVDDIVLFSDKQHKEWMPLCGKPNCSHGLRELDCNAHLEGDAMCIWVYGEHLYYAFLDDSSVDYGVALQLWRMNFDGSDHELVASPSYTDEGLGMSFSKSMRWSFHNKYLLIDYISEAEDSASKKKWFSLDISQPDKGFSRLEFALDGGEETVGIMSMRYGEGDIIYSTDALEGSTVYKLDLADRTARTLGTLQFEERGIRYCCLHDGKLYFASCWEEGLIASIDVETGEVETVNTAEPNSTLWYYPIGEYIIGASPDYGLGTACGTAVYDMSGAEIQRIDCEDYGEDLVIACILGHYAFGMIGTNDPSREDIIEYLDRHAPEWYLDLNDIGTDDFMWRRWEPEG